mmetsp:Transcript_11935/g.36381  ORF Transcript_11935/g.36381 Transcript_11935/m.36381 type:complete len:928 (+) Transcript_11935:200-2983(+)
MSRSSSVKGRLSRWAKQKDGTRVVANDPLLESYAEALRYRFGRYWELRQSVDILEGGLHEFSQGHKWFGLNVSDAGITYREWAPGASEVYICGDFNQWNKRQYNLQRENYGYWSITLPRRQDGSLPIPHMSKIKTVIVVPGGEILHRNPVASVYLLQDGATKLFDTVFWNPLPQDTYTWKEPKWLPRPECLRIYECHVGMATKDARVGTYVEFADNILPRIKRLGYTAIQVMAVAEHAYYGSFGYHVTNPFAPSSRCGTPDDLKYLVDKAHGMQLMVLMDIVHSHMSSNSMDGIALFDGTDGQYFHEGEQGRHREWDSRLFNYGHWEVLRMLLSNLRWWLEEYHFDGFRFDGVTSMLYKHHGVNVSFSGDYSEYFGFHVDVDACVYIMLANELIHELNPQAITVAEEVSGAPTICQPVADGGLGFDLRLGMGIPNMWITLLTQRKDEEWGMGELVHGLTNRRDDERIIAYVESHDQAIVGDKTFAHWLMGEELYRCMGTNISSPPIIDRGLALLKLIRLITYALGGEAYLNFMGNEFGHPEWIDFPREGNGFSHNMARRRWDLADDKNLRFHQLELWDQSMHECEEQFRFCRPDHHRYIVHVSDSDKVIVFERGNGLLFAFNFHPSASYTNYRVGAAWSGTYEVVLDSDALEVGGHARIQWDVKHRAEPLTWMGRSHSLCLYLPSRSAQVYHVVSSRSDLARRTFAEPPAPSQTTPLTTSSASKSEAARTVDVGHVTSAGNFEAKHKKLSQGTASSASHDGEKPTSRGPHVQSSEVSMLQSSHGYTDTPVSNMSCSATLPQPGDGCFVLELKRSADRPPAGGEINEEKAAASKPTDLKPHHQTERATAEDFSDLEAFLAKTDLNCPAQEAEDSGARDENDSDPAGAGAAKNDDLNENDQAYEELSRLVEDAMRSSKTDSRSTFSSTR